MKRSVLVKLLAVLVGVCSAFAPPIFSSGAIRLANPLWIDLDGAPYQVGTLLEGSTLYHGITDRSGAPAVLSEEDQRELVTLYEMASVSWLRGHNLEELRTWQRAMRDFVMQGALIRFFDKVQQELVGLGVVATAAYFTGGSVVLNSLSQAALDELTQAVVNAPRSAAIGWSATVLAASQRHFAELVAGVERHVEESRGESAQTPLDGRVIFDLYQRALWVDIYTMPSAQLIRDLQPQPDWASQLRRSANTAVDSAAGAFFSPAEAKYVTHLVRTGRFLAAMKEGVPELAAYDERVERKRRLWEESRTGTGESLVAAPIYREAVLWSPPAALEGLGGAVLAWGFDEDPGLRRYRDAAYRGSCRAEWRPDKGDLFTEVQDQAHGSWYCLAELPRFAEVSNHGDFRVRFDYNPITMNWGQFPSLFFVSSRIHDRQRANKDYALRIQMTWTDSHDRNLFITSHLGKESSRIVTPTIPAENLWLSFVLDYDAKRRLLDVDIVQRDSGRLFFRESGIPFEVMTPFDTIAIGEGSLDHRKYGTLGRLAVDNIEIRCGSF